MEVCNAAQDGKCLRYKKKNWSERKYGSSDFINAFEKRIKIMKSDIQDCPIEVNRSQASVRGDTQKAGSWDRAGQNYKLCVMSPPSVKIFRLL